MIALTGNELVYFELDQVSILLSIGYEFNCVDYKLGFLVVILKIRLNLICSAAKE